MTTPRQEPTLIETGDGHLVALSLTGIRVTVDWSGPRHAELTADEARSIGYLLRRYAQICEPTSDPGQ